MGLKEFIKSLFVSEPTEDKGYEALEAESEKALKDTAKARLKMAATQSQLAQDKAAYEAAYKRHTEVSGKFLEAAKTRHATGG